jgi:hypothetical protein
MSDLDISLSTGLGVLVDDDQTGTSPAGVDRH